MVLTWVLQPAAGCPVKESSDNSFPDNVVGAWAGGRKRRATCFPGTGHGRSLDSRCGRFGHARRGDPGRFDPLDLVFSPAAAPPSLQPAAQPIAAEVPAASLACYASGEEVHLGDRVRYRDTLGRVVFVSDGTQCQCANGYEDYRGYDAGILVCDDDGGTDFVGEGDSQLELVGHRDS